ncbi:MAG: NAD(P)/FAD-dependent oxidoreductase [Candidatus Edwardsbacteria bacterium]|nr:NAD(P)/FAD-dependent oxidoreductase [Candidatus Edwardsbacteria bacterium]
MLSFRCTVIGAGAVGLAVARALAARFHGENDVLVVEQGKSFGTGISSRNSEVVHSGLYYPTGSLKHRLCVGGRRALYQYCEARGVPFKKCGKLVVAADAVEEPELEALYQKGLRNGIENVERLTGGQAAALEPEVRASAALFLAETGIFDTHSYMKALESDIAADNGTVSYESEVVALDRAGAGYRLRLRSGEEFGSATVVNAGGLGAPAVARMPGLEPEAMHPCKGSYFAYAGTHRVTHLVYPIPEKGLTGLGVHATIDLAGRLRFGPDVEYVSSTDDFTVDERKLAAFQAAARRLFPAIDAARLAPDQAGVRPKLQGPGDDEVRDFVIREEAGRGFPGFVDLLGIESPGLTASLAIGEQVADLLRQA